MYYTYPLQHIVAVARQGSSFYRDAFRDLPQTGWELADIPITRFETAQAIYHDGYDALLTAPVRDGILSASSGTTGRPKFSVTTRQEWETFNRLVSLYHWRSGLIRDGDRVANVAMAGHTRLAFLSVTHQLQVSPARCVELPISGTEDTEYLVEMSRQLGANVLAGLTMTLVNMAYHIEKHALPPLQIDTILYGGEVLYGSQLEYLRAAFPGARIASFMYASNEAGVVGYSDLTCAPGEHIAIGEAAIVEIVDGNGKVITTTGESGRVVVTSLSKALMPFIRNEIGDVGHWVDDEGADARRFVIEGRVASHPRDDVDTLTSTTVRQVMDAAARSHRVLRAQAVQRDHEVTVSLAVAEPNSEHEAIRATIEGLFASRVGAASSRDTPIHVVFVEPEQIPTTDPTSAKHKLLIDAD